MATFAYDDTSEQNELISRVVVYADKETPSAQSVGINQKAVYDNLKSATRSVLEVAPRDEVDEVASDGSGQSASASAGSAEIPLPEDFMRFLALRLGEWERTLYELVDPRSNQVRLQSNTYTAADPHNPVATKVAAPAETSGAKLRCWPPGAASVDEFAYLPELPPEDAPEVLKEAIILWATSYTLAADKEEGWEIMRQAAQIILQQVEAGQKPFAQAALRQARAQEDS